MEARTEEISVRDAQPDDAEALARVHADVARYYDERSTHYFDEGHLRLVAEIEGEVVGALTARLLEPAAAGGDGRGEAERRLRIDYLATAAASRRAGIGTRLVQAAESWGRKVGATIAETTAFRGSALSIPFWEDRMGYEELPMSLEKRLDATSPA
ncbi:MAG: N-acetyltransferase family protein [Solirubrobacteraceae bacterium]